MKNPYLHIFSFLEAYRWFFGIAVWLILCLLEIHGSSIGAYAYLFGEDGYDTAILGINRGCRLDEFMVSTPIAFSQYYDLGQGNFCTFNEILRANPTNVGLLFGQPCWNFITVFRPFLWGYLFLPKGMGLSFFWIGRLVVLFLSSYEFSLIITNQKKKISIIYGLMIGFSPIVQWWFATNSFVEMLIFGQLGIVFLFRYFYEKRKKIKNIYNFGIFYCIVGYCFALYPSWQIPFAYIFFCIAFWIMHQHHVKFSSFMNFRFSLFAIMTGVLILYFFYSSLNEVHLIQHSEYPGQRFIMGGDVKVSEFFRYIYMLILPISVEENAPLLEIATFISFSPCGILLAFWLRIRYNYKDFLVWELVVICGVFALFCLLSWPIWLVKITLLYEVLERRLVVAMDFIQIIILFRILSINPFVLRLKETILCIFLYIIFVLAWWDFELYQQYTQLFLGITLFFLCLSVLSIFRYRKMFNVSMCLICILSGMTVNPIAQGIQSIYETKMGMALAKIENNDRGIWLVEASKLDWGKDGIWPLNDYPIMFGAPTINSFQYYVCWSRWNQFSLTEEDKKALNRSGHMNIILTNSHQTSFQCLRQYSSTADVVNILLNISDLPKLGVSHILTSNNLEEMNTEHIIFTPIAECKGYKIYRVYY